MKRWTRLGGVAALGIVAAVAVAVLVLRPGQDSDAGGASGDPSRQVYVALPSAELEASRYGVSDSEAPARLPASQLSDSDARKVSFVVRTRESGRVSLGAVVRLSPSCPPADRNTLFLWFELDGTPLRQGFSVTEFWQETQAVSVIGYTSEPVPPGDHPAGIGVACRAGVLSMRSSPSLLSLVADLVRKPAQGGGTTHSPGPSY